MLLQSRSIIACKCISKLARSQPQRASPNSIDHGLQVHLLSSLDLGLQVHLLSSLDLGLQVHLQTRSITASKCFSRLARLRSASSHDHGLQVHLQTRSITASMYIFNERRWVYRDTGVTEVHRVTGSIYSADPGVDRHHLISISSYHTMKIHTLSFPTFGLTRSVRDPRNCVDPHGRVVSYLLTFFLRSSSLT